MSEVTLTQVNEAIEASNRAFSEFKSRIEKQVTDGQKADPEVLRKLNEAMDKASEVNDKLIETRTIVDRMSAAGFQTTEGETSTKSVEMFNAQTKAAAMRSGRVHVISDATGVKAYNESFDKLLRKGPQALTEIELKALSVGTDVDGGYTVSPDKTGRLVQKLFETSPMRQFSSVQMISTDALEGLVDLDEASCGWVSELGTRSESNTPAVPKPWKIPAHEAYAEPRISQKLAEDSAIDIVGWLQGKVADKFNRLFNAAFVTGTGAGRPRGFASYTTAATADGARDWGTPEHVATGTSGGFGTDPNAITKLLSLIHAMKDGYTANAAFYMNRTTLGAVRGLTDASSAGKFVFIPSWVAGAPDTLLGYPVRKLQDMATYSTASALGIAFGDMQAAYQIVDRLGVSVLVDPYTAKPYIKYYTRARVGGDVLDFEAIKFLKFA